MSEFDEQLQADESELTGKWLFQNGQMIGDITCRRIEWLIQHHLQKFADSSDGGGWVALYRDPDVGRFWEKNHPQSEMQGGGPPQLRTLTDEEVKNKYGAQ